MAWIVADAEEAKFPVKRVRSKSSSVHQVQILAYPIDKSDLESMSEAQAVKAQ